MDLLAWWCLYLLKDHSYMHKYIYIGITASYFLARHFERYRLCLKVFWEGFYHGWIAALCQATMLQSSRQKG